MCQKIEEHNSAGRSFTTGLNKWADLTPIEFQYLMRKKVYLSKKNRSGIIGDDVALPVEVDWRKKGCVSPVVNQGRELKDMACVIDGIYDYAVNGCVSVSAFS